MMILAIFLALALLLAVGFAAFHFAEGAALASVC